MNDEITTTTRRGALVLLLGAPAVMAAQPPEVTHCTCSDGSTVALVRLGEREAKRRKACARDFLRQLQEAR